METTTTDVSSLTDQAQHLSLTEHVGGLQGGDAKRANFPLPRELRDQIYSYLLHHEHTTTAPYYERDVSKRSEYSVKSRREKSAAHTFAVRTDILAVNQQIHEEAGQIPQRTTSSL